jgi:hypothetical protein
MWLEPPLYVVSIWVIKRVYIILIWNIISRSSNLDNYFYHCLVFTLILYLKVLFNSSSSSSSSSSSLLFIIYIVNLHVVRPRSCRVIYYFKFLSANVDLWPFQLQYLELKKSIVCKLNFFGFLTRRPISLPNFRRKWAHIREIWVF